MSLSRPSHQRAAPSDRPRLKTRDRILDVCRELFNERGPASVTTAEIARSLGINEGNLYYHFKRKEDLLEALFERFSAELLKTASTEAEGPAGVERYRAYLDGWFRIMWEWRFFYRDGAAVFQMAPGLRSRLRTVSDEGISLTRGTVVEMSEAGLIAISGETLDRTITNAWIIATYWIDHLRSRRAIETPTRDEIDEGAAQILSLFKPYLTETGAALASPRPSLAHADRTR